VARSLFAKFRYPCTKLLTLATPHCGLLDFASIFSPVPAAAAMLRNSRELNWLNNHPVDISARPRYRFHGVSFNGMFGFDYHDDDGLVPITSAMGLELQPRPEGMGRIHLANRTHAPLDGLVHMKELLEPSCIMPFIDDCQFALQHH